MEITQEQKTYAQIIQKAWEDEGFRDQLQSNPAETIEKFTGKKLTLPEGKSLVVCDQTDESVVYINLFTKPNLDDMELSDSQLEAVAGGTWNPFEWAVETGVKIGIWLAT